MARKVIGHIGKKEIRLTGSGGLCNNCARTMRGSTWETDGEFQGEVWRFHQGTCLTGWYAFQGKKLKMAKEKI